MTEATYLSLSLSLSHTHTHLFGSMFLESPEVGLGICILTSTPGDYVIMGGWTLQLSSESFREYWRNGN